MNEKIMRIVRELDGISKELRALARPDGVNLEDSNLITITKACRFLDLPPWKLRSLDKQGVLIPTKRHAKGYRYYTMGQLEAYAASIAPKTAPKAIDPEDVVDADDGSIDENEDFEDEPA